MNKEIFREYDIRGIFPEDLDEKSVKAIAYLLGVEMKKRGVKTVSLGYDARLSADILKGFMLAGLNKAGLEIFDIGMNPTPVGYFSVFTDIFDANIMITGSHNPKNYNGFKITIGKDSFFGKDIQKLADEVEKFLQKDEEILDNDKCEKYDVLPKYIEFFEKSFSQMKDFTLPFVLDCGNGVAGITLKKIVEKLNLNAILLFPEPDGNFPNHHPDPSEEKNLQDIKKIMKEKDIKFGFAFDGDADRIAVLESDRIIKGDELAYLYAKNIKNPRVLGEVKCSQNMYNEIDKFGKTFMGKTGHSNIKKAMKELNIDLATEVSGHIFFKERYFGFDDAVYAFMRVLELLHKGIDLNLELEKLPKLYASEEIKIKASDKNKFKIVADMKEFLFSKPQNLPEIKEIIDIDGVRVRFENSWALLRASNTSPVLVTRFEAKSQEILNKLQKDFNELIQDLKAKYE